MVIGAITLISSMDKVNAVAKTITLGNAEAISGYVAGTYFSIKKTTSGEYVYCLDIHKGTAANITAKLVGKKDAGLAYILENGYPNKSFTGERKKDYYITQTAVWWYLDSTTGSSNLGQSFKTDGSDPYNLRPYIKKLVTNAKKAQKKGYAKTTLKLSINNTKLSLSKDGKYFISEEISVTSSNIDKYTVNLTNAPTGTVTIDLNGNKKKKFKASEKFQVRVPVSKVTEISSKFKVTATATGTIKKAYEYQPTDQSMQSVMPAILEKEETTKESTLTLNISTSKVSITKIDKSTTQPLSGAQLALRDGNGNVVTRWTSSTNAHIISNLSNGTYSVVEEKAPEGYKLNTEPTTFTITDANRDIKITVYNEIKNDIVSILKVDKSTNQPLSGARLVLKDANGNVKARWESTTEAYTISNLSNGTYSVIEEKAPEGYELNKEPTTFTITDTNKNIRVTVYNKAKTSVVNILKIDKSTGTPLAGATLLVTNSNGEEIATIETTTDPYVLTNLPYGTYTVEEVSAPDGYILSSEKITFTIDDQNLSHQITFENYPEVIVPNTISNSSIIFSILGIIILSIGIGFVYKNGQKTK